MCKDHAYFDRYLYSKINVLASSENEFVETLTRIPTDTTQCCLYYRVQCAIDVVGAINIESTDITSAINSNYTPMYIFESDWTDVKLGCSPVKRLQWR